MTLSDFQASADLIGRRLRLAWKVTYAEGETLADTPAHRIRRKERDFQFLPPPGPLDPFGVYDSTAFPPLGTVATDLPVEEGRAGDIRWVRIVTSVHIDVSGVPVEVLRRTQTTWVRDDGQPTDRDVEILDFGATIGGLLPNVTYYYLLETPAGMVSQATARPGEGYGISRRLYDMIPAVHRRHDTVARGVTVGAEAIREAAPRAGQLQRFLDLFGTSLDLMRSTAEGLPGLHDLDTVDAQYLPLLAQWIGWTLSTDRSIPSQRHEIRNAPARYRLTGTIPSTRFWTRHATAWDSRVKEYLHNVVRSNEPPALNLWLRTHDGAAWSDPERAFLLDDVPLGRPSVVTTPDGVTRLFYHSTRMNRTGIWTAVFRPGEGWSAERPVRRGRTRDTHPAAVVRPDGTLWLFYSTYDTARRRWSVRLQTRPDGGRFGPPDTLDAVLGLPPGERRHPTATVDPNGALWLFWMERSGTRWVLRYARFDGAWSGAIDFPDEGGAAVAVEGHPFAIAFDTAGPTRRLWLFFRQTAATGDPAQTRSVLAVRAKANLAANAGGWGPVQILSDIPPAFHDDDPAAYANPDGDLDLVFSSNRASGWSLWRRTFDEAGDAWTAPEALPATPYHERHPLPFVLDGQPAVLHRSDRSPVYESVLPGGIRSFDFRYAGSILPDTLNGDALALTGRFGDFKSYTPDFGQGRRTDADRYAEDTVGLFVTPDSVDAAVVAQGVSRLRQVLPMSLPATERGVLVTEPDVHAEFVYDYRRPGQPAPRFIDEAYQDTFTSDLGTVVFGSGFDFTDALDEP